MNKSKAMKNLEADLVAKKEEAQVLQDKKDVTADEVTAVTNAIKSVKAEIALQKELDDGLEFDVNGLEVEDLEPVNKPPVGYIKDRKTPFASFGDQLQAIAKSAQQGAPVDSRLLEVQNATGASEGQPSEGGYLVQTDFASGIMKEMWETSVLAPLCKNVPISSGANSVVINGFDETSRADGARAGGVQGYWVEEAGTITPSKPAYRQIELKPKKLATLYYATEELMSDAGALQSEVMSAFADEMSFKVDDAIFRGDGSGKPLGIINSGAILTTSKETGQAADTVIHENIAKMWARLISTSRASAVWLINQEVETQLDNMAMSIGTGGTVSPFAMEWALSRTIKGRPVIANEFSSKLGDLGDIVVADFKRYKLANKGPAKLASSIHIAFLTDEIAFRTTYRVDGQPDRASAITAFKGNDTLSNYVMLQAR